VSIAAAHSDSDSSAETHVPAVMTVRETGMALVAIPALNAGLWVVVVPCGLDPLVVAPTLLFGALSAVVVVRVVRL